MYKLYSSGSNRYVSFKIKYLDPYATTADCFLRMCVLGWTVEDNIIWMVNGVIAKVPAKATVTACIISRDPSQAPE